MECTFLFQPRLQQPTTISDENKEAKNASSSFRIQLRKPDRLPEPFQSRRRSESSDSPPVASLSPRNSDISDDDVIEIAQETTKQPVVQPLLSKTPPRFTIRPRSDKPPVSQSPEYQRFERSPPTNTCYDTAQLVRTDIRGICGPYLWKDTLGFLYDKRP